MISVMTASYNQENKAERKAERKAGKAERKAERKAEKSERALFEKAEIKRKIPIKYILFRIVIALYVTRSGF
jgi:hypothetical protein